MRYRQFKKSDNPPLSYSVPRSLQTHATFRFRDVLGSFQCPWGGVITRYVITSVVRGIVLYQVPSGVFLDARAPEQGKAISLMLQYEDMHWTVTHGVDFPAPRWSKRTILYFCGLKKLLSFGSVPPPGPPNAREISTGNYLRRIHERATNHGGRRLYAKGWQDQTPDDRWGSLVGSPGTPFLFPLCS